MPSPKLASPIRLGLALPWAPTMTWAFPFAITKMLDSKREPGLPAGPKLNAFQPVVLSGRRYGDIFVSHKPRHNPERPASGDAGIQNVTHML